MSKGSNTRPCADEDHRRAEHERIFSVRHDRSVEAWKAMRKDVMAVEPDKKQVEK